MKLFQVLTFTLKKRNVQFGQFHQQRFCKLKSGQKNTQISIGTEHCSNVNGQRNVACNQKSVLC